MYLFDSLHGILYLVDTALGRPHSNIVVVLVAVHPAEAGMLVWNLGGIKGSRL